MQGRPVLVLLELELRPNLRILDGDPVVARGRPHGALRRGLLVLARDSERAGNSHDRQLAHPPHGESVLDRIHGRGQTLQSGDGCWSEHDVGALLEQVLQWQGIRRGRSRGIGQEPGILINRQYNTQH